MNINRIIEQIALIDGVSPEDVRRDMQEAITLARSSAASDAKETWDQLSADSPEDVILFCARMLTP
ncbi:MAG: hypothetical protein ACI4PM_04135 [Butyricicoccus sp.]